MNEEQVCFSLIEKLESIFKEYGEEQMLSALWVCLKREFISSNHFDPLIESRMNDLVEIVSKWESQNEPL